MMMHISQTFNVWEKLAMLFSIQDDQAKERMEQADKERKEREDLAKRQAKEREEQRIREVKEREAERNAKK